MNKRNGQPTFVYREVWCVILSVSERKKKIENFRTKLFFYCVYLI